MRRSSQTCQQLTLRALLVAYSGFSLVSAALPVAASIHLVASNANPGMVGLAFAAYAMSTTLTFPLGGILGDCVSRKSAMVASEGFRVLVLAFMLIATDENSDFTVIFFLVILGFSEGLYDPAFSGILPEIAGRKIQRANVWVGIIQTAAGAVIGVLVVSLVYSQRLSSVIILAICVDVVAAAILAKAKASSANRAARLPAHTPYRSSSFIRSQLWLSLLIVQSVLYVAVVWAPFWTLGPLVTQGQTVGSLPVWGIAISGFYFGSLIASIAILRAGLPGIWLLVTGAIFGWAAPTVGLLSGDPFWLIVLSVIGGLATPGPNVVIITAVQRSVSPGTLSRVSAVLSIASGLGHGMGSLVAGGLGGYISPELLFAAGVGWQVTSSIVLLASSKALRVTLLRGVQK